MQQNKTERVNGSFSPSFWRTHKPSTDGAVNSCSSNDSKRTNFDSKNRDVGEASHLIGGGDIEQWQRMDAVAGSRREHNRAFCFALRLERDVLEAESSAVAGD